MHHSSVKSSRINRVAIIGLDGGTLDVFKPLAAQGLMPAMQRLFERGAWGPLTSVIPPVTGPAWASFLTGKQPGKHGIFSFVKRSSDRMRLSPVNYADIKSSTLLSIVGHQAGKRVCAFNVPITFPPPDINGIVVSGLLTPDTDVQFTQPPGLKEELIAKYGQYELDAFWQRFSDNSAADFLSHLMAYEGRKFEQAHDLLRRGPWDLFIAVFVGPDRIQHALWHIIDAVITGRKLPARQEKLKEPVRKYFRLLDNRLQDLLAAMDHDTTVLIMSDHGFGPLKKKFYLNSWLRREGFLDFDLERAGRMAKSGSWKRFLKKRLQDFPLTARLAALRGPGSGGLQLGTGNSLDLIKWSKTTAYSATSTEQGIYLNLKGREAHGIVNPGDEAEDLLNQISSCLRELKDAEDGMPLVNRLYRRPEIYHGPYAENGPDLIFFLREGEQLADVKFTDKLSEKASWLTGRGTHRFEGIFMALGEDVRKGFNAEGLKITDVAPTALYLLDLPIPADMDGRVAEMIFENSLLAQRRPHFHEEAAGPEDGGFSLSSEEEGKIFQKLKDLGYME